MRENQLPVSVFYIKVGEMRGNQLPVSGFLHKGW
jgi:hypothetical protein